MAEIFLVVKGIELETQILAVLLALVLIHIAVTWILAIRRGIAARRKFSSRAKNGELFLPAVSILVPAWKESGMVERCIQALASLNYPEWEAIILAGGPDGTYEAAKRAAGCDPRFRIMERGPEPKNVALSRGIQTARHDILVFLDADCIVDPNWLRALVQPLNAGASVSLAHSQPSRRTWISMVDLMQFTQMYFITENYWIQGDRSFAVKREAIERIGGLPSHTFAREDWDLGIKWAQTGDRIAFAPDAYLQTEWPATLAEYWNREVRWRRTHLKGLWEHRAFFIKQPFQAFMQFYFYLFSAAVTIAFLVGLLLALVFPSLWPPVFQVFALAAAWIAFRRAALAAEVAIFTQDIHWAWRSIHLVALLFLILVASNYVLLTIRQKTPFDYKGPRLAAAR